MFDYVELGNKLLSVRLNRGKKQKEIGNALGITQAAYSAIELGKHKISIEQLFVISEVLEVDIVWLLGIDMHGGLTETESFKLSEYKNLLIQARKGLK